MNLKKKKMKLKQKRNKHSKEISKLKVAYKSRKLKFDSKKIAEAILKDFKKSFTSRYKT